MEDRRPIEPLWRQAAKRSSAIRCHGTTDRSPAAARAPTARWPEIPSE
ncbi:CxxxxCH/CxxCH domain-containing protein [Bradyrhizobium elkanii]